MPWPSKSRPGRIGSACLLDSQKLSRVDFSVYKRETNEDERLNSDLNFGELVNLLYPKLRWISTAQNFESSSEIARLQSEIDIAKPVTDLLFLDWLHRVCIDFLENDGSYLLIIDACLSFNDEFAQLIFKVIGHLDMSTDAVSIWPIAGQHNENFDELFPVENLSYLAFLLTRAGAQKIISQFKLSPTGLFADLIKESGLVCESVSKNSTGRPYLLIELAKSQDSYLATYPLQRLNQKETFETLKPPRVKAFISHWFSTLDSIHEVEDACRKFGYETEVLNTTDEKREGWTNSIPISFFRQVEYACNNFDSSNDFMLFITADVRSNNWTKFFMHANRVLSLKGLGSFSPSLSSEWNLLGRIENLHFDAKSSLAVVPTNDIILTYIHKSVVLEMQLFFKFFASHPDTFNPLVGFQVSLLMNRIIYSSGLFSVRDRKFKFMHPYGQSYDLLAGLGELDPIKAIEDDFFSERIPLFGLDNKDLDSVKRLEEIIQGIRNLEI